MGSLEPKLLIFMIFFFVLACSNQPSYEGVDSSFIVPKDDSETSSISNEGIVEDDDDEDEEEITAIPPSVISGAHLTCSPTKKDSGSKTVEISCYFERDGKILDDVELKQSDLLIRDEGGTKLISDFKKNNDGTYTFKTHMNPDANIVILLESLNGNSLADDVDISTMSVRIEHETIEKTEDKQEEAAADVIPPLETSIIINEGEEYTKTEAVNLSLNAIDAAQMYITNSEGCLNHGTWEPYSSSKDWTLEQTNKAAKVYIKFRDLAGNESDCISDSIIHDNIAPTSPGLTIGSSNFTSTVSNTLFPTADDATEMYITNVAACVSGGVWEPYSSTRENWELAGTDAILLVMIKYRDAAGNESNCVSDNIRHDPNPPSDPTTIDDGSFTTTAQDSPTITWGPSSDSETGIAYYDVSIGSDLGDTSIKDWTNVGNVTTISFSDLDLSSGETYYVNIRAIDTAGNQSNVVSGDGFVYNHCKSVGSGENWILVPGSEFYETSDFCVMKFEAKDQSGTPVSASAGTPWVSITQPDAIAKCDSLGTDFHLINNAEWMTIATNIADISANWSGDSPGLGELSRGHSDNNPSTICEADSNDQNAYVEGSCTGASTGTFNQKRTHILSNGQIIWDLAGNVSEWTSGFNKDDKPLTPDRNSYFEYTAVSGSSTMLLTELIPQIAIDQGWDSSKSIGRFDPGPDNLGGVLRRSGDFDNNQTAGIFKANLRQSITAIRTDTGFRCAKSISQ